ncbi:MAG: hypothetical protein K1060chlam4_01706, partial [Candidatus Anoxychlamydiales bacterium]|nr:hypothetical protein [Candidatus Anoxychlamydiales bacterium]
DGDFIEGVYISVKRNTGTDGNSNLYKLENTEGMRNVWGSAILDSRMDDVKIGDKLKITYKGLGEAKPGKNAPKIFKVEVDDMVEEETKETEKETEKPSEDETTDPDAK